MGEDQTSEKPNSEREETEGFARAAMLRAISARSTDEVRRLLDEGVSADILTSPASLQTALMEAAREGCGDIMELLIARGADLELRDEDGWSALDIVDYFGDEWNVADILLRHGAVRNPDLKTSEDQLNEYYEAREGLQSDYFDDRVCVYEITYGSSERLLTGESWESWKVIARRNVHRYPPVSTAEFKTLAEANEFLRRGSPATPRVSLGHRPPDPIPSWEEHKAWVDGIEAAAREKEAAVRNRMELAALLKWPKPRRYNKHGKRQRYGSSSPPCLQERALRAAVLRKLEKPRKGKRRMLLEPAQPMTRLVPAKPGRLRSEMARAENAKIMSWRAPTWLRPLRRDLFTENPRRRLLHQRLGVIVLSQAHLVVSRAMKPRRTNGNRLQLPIEE